MSPDDLLFTPVTDLASRIASGEITASELVDGCIAQIDRHNCTLNAITTPALDLARDQAATLDREARAGRIRSPLHGIPIVVKDVLDLEGFPTTAGSNLRRDHVASRSAPAIERLIRAGAIILGKTNCDEFMRGGTSVDSCFGKTPNAWNPHHIPGGSSGGSAVAVASGMALASIGTDSGGSVVGPAAFCNLAGIRPTFGRVTRAGVVPLAPSFDTTGPIARTVADTALMLQVIAGPDDADPATGSTPPPDFSREIGRGLEGLTIGVPESYVWLGYEPEVEGIVRAAIEDLQSLGATIVNVELPWASVCRAVFNAVMAAESSDYHRAYLRDRRDDYVSPGADFFEQGLFMPAWRYVQAQRARTWMMRQAAEVFGRVDAIVTPTHPIAAPSFETCRVGMPVQATISHCKRPFAPLGVPALQVPAGFTQGGLPVGMQLVSPWGNEALLFRIGAAYERLRPWWKRRPPLGEATQPVSGFDEWSRAAEEEVPGGASRSIRESDVIAFANGIGHRVDQRRLATLTNDINREMVRLSALDALPLDGCARADRLDLLSFTLGPRT
jgi:aspartyl-tRNA(Asn)/glutamyl-tRNA(Gln) amidotransferase subunit A